MNNQLKMLFLSQKQNVYKAKDYFFILFECYYYDKRPIYKEITGTTRRAG